MSILKEKFVAETLESGQLQTHKSTLIRTDKNKDNSNSSNYNQKSKRFVIWFKLIKNNQEVVFVLKGHKAKTLKALVENNEKGCTALDISKTFALRLSEYIRALRRDYLCGGYNLDIIKHKEPNPTGWHGRYVLTDKVEILPNKPNDQEQS
jgi:hypothetical protein